MTKLSPSQFMRPAGARSPTTDPVGAHGFTQLPTGYFHEGLRREELAEFIPPKTARNQRSTLLRLASYFDLTLSHGPAKDRKLSDLSVAL